MAHEKPARRLVDQRGRRSRTLYRKLNKCKCRVLYWLEKVLKMISLYVNARLCTLQHIVIHAMQLSGVNSANAKYFMVREGAENDLLVRQCTFVHAAAYCHTRDATQQCQFCKCKVLTG